MTTKLTKIKFTAGLTGEGYQETDSKGRLIHLYDNEGDQIDTGNGHFPNAEFEAIGKPVVINDPDDFWNAISQ